MRLILLSVLESLLRIDQLLRVRLGLVEAHLILLQHSLLLLYGRRLSGVSHYVL